MRDVLLRGLLPGAGLRVLFVRAGDLSRMARMLHGLAPTSAAVFGEALAAGLLLGALQKEHTRVNLSLEVDGPISGVLVDADTEGNVRGRVRQPSVHFPGDPAVGPRAALGGSGTLSVLRDLGSGEFYRGSVEFVPGTLTENLRRYFAASEQVGSALDIRVLPAGGEPLGDVAGLLVQRLPEGDPAALEAIRRRLAAGALPEALGRGRPAVETVEQVVGSGLQVLAEMEVSYTCPCSRERAVNAVSALGLEGLLSVLEEERELVIDCEFCRKRYVIPEEEIRAMARALSAQGGGAKA